MDEDSGVVEIYWRLHTIWHIIIDGCFICFQLQAYIKKDLSFVIFFGSEFVPFFFVLLIIKQFY